MPSWKSGFKKSERCSEKITQIPRNPSTRPVIALEGKLEPALNKPITTSHNGKMAPIIAPSPAEIYFTPQVDNALLSIKFKKLSISMGYHSFPFGHAFPLTIKKLM